MLEAEIPFEIHLTTEMDTSNQLTKFVDFCANNNFKPLVIELSRGNFSTQPMLSMVLYTKEIQEVFSKITTISAFLNDRNFSTKRIKIEVPHTHFKKFENFHTGFEKYFEWHCKIDYINIFFLIELCEKHKVHLSKNSLKNENNRRFITLREFGTIDEFEKRINQVVNELDEGNWIIRKQESEYCIYDSNSILDNGWIN